MNYTPQELMVAAAAREIRDGEVVFVGMRLPLIAFALARTTHAPTAVGLFELGIVRDTPAPELLYTMGDAPNIAGATWCARMADLMGLMQAGAVHAGFIGGAEIDRHGNLNTSYIGPRDAPQVKLPGSGGGADIASLAQRLLIIMPHERRRFVERVGYITSPGYGDGAGWRERVGLPRGGPTAVITTLGVLGFDRATGEAFLRSYHPGQSPETVRANTGWDLKVASDISETPAPTDEELAIIRRYDPQGFWTRSQ
jgi:glutaconate CoA-transferase subunit B